MKPDMFSSAKDEYRDAPVVRDERFPKEDYRSSWRRDYGRLIHCPSFRRLQGKTQLFPGQESDFFRNRLTHSLEVAQIAKSITIRLNSLLKKNKEKITIEPDIVEFAGLAHDLGHPPFGHFGEKVLNEKMLQFGGFEANAQTLRILAVTEKKIYVGNTTLGITKDGQDVRLGLGLAARSLASILKYDRLVPVKTKERMKLIKKLSLKKTAPIKGYYESDKNIVETIKKCVLGRKKSTNPFKTIECSIMDIADDIAYSTHDLEDSFKAGFVQPIDLISADDATLERVVKKVNSSLGVTLSIFDAQKKIREVFFDIFDSPFEPQMIKEMIKMKGLSTTTLNKLHFASIAFAKKLSEDYAKNAYNRGDLTSKLVGSAIRSVTIKNINRKIPALSTVELDKNKAIEVELLKHFVYESQIMSPKIQIAAYRSREILTVIFDALDQGGNNLLPEDFRKIYTAFMEKDELNRTRTLCDFIAGMTDRYALEFYGRLTSENPQTIFKPI